MFKRLLPLLICIGLPVFLFGQYKKVGFGYQLGAGAGPISTDTASSWVSRFAYIYPADELGNIKHGDTIQSIEINRSAGVAMLGGGNLILSLNNTNSNDFGAGIVKWSTATSGATIVYNQNPQTDIGNKDAYYRINFNSAVYVYDTTKGKNLMLFFDWKQTAKQTGKISFYYDSKFYVSNYLDNQCKWYTGRSTSDSLPNSSDNHPHIIINYPRYTKDIEVLGIYTMGKLPVPLGNPDSVMAYVRNVGKKKIVSQQMELRLKGANKMADTSSFSIDMFEEKFVTLSSLFPRNKGIDTVVINGIGDDNLSNNSQFTLRLDNENVYSYRDITQGPGAGGIGFNGSTGNFVARFSSNIPKYINQVTVYFAISGRPFRIAIWEQKKNKALPGKLLWQSDSLTTVAGNYILNIPKPVYVNGNFFVGVRQLSASNVAFGYQDEFPVRPSTFFYSAPLADTNWVDFAPDAPYRFFIEPRLQADTDIVVLSCDLPKDTIDAYTTDTLAPKATVQNIGIQDMKSKIDIHCDIYFNAVKVYSDKIQDTLSAGVKRQYTFAKKYFPKDFGEMKMVVYVKPPGDKVVDNDTAIRKFYVGVKRDVMVQTVFEPYDMQQLNYFTDSIVPVALIKNIGYDATGSFITRCKILRGTQVLYNKTIALSFTKFQSQIINFPTYKCFDTGRLRVIFTTELSNDKYKPNDTQQFRVFVNKIYDLSADTLISPGKFDFLSPGKAASITFKGANDGLLTAYNAAYFVEIVGNYPGATMFTDSLKFTADGVTAFTKTFAKKFTPSRKGMYQARIYCRKFNNDFIRTNDTLNFKIYCGFPYDYRSLSAEYPKNGDTIAVGGGPYMPSVKIQNNGFTKTTDLCPVVCQIWRGSSMVHNDITSVNLDTGVSYTVNFTKSFSPVNFGDYKLIFYTNLFSDLQRKNDTIITTFHVKIGKDPSMLLVDTPYEGARYEAKVTPLNIKGKWKNYGNLTVKSLRYFIDVYKGRSLVYATSSPLDSLKGKEEKDIVKNTGYVFQDSGNYKVLVYCYSPDDQNPYNDSIIVNINVMKSKDIKLTQWKNPLNGQVILHTNGQAPLMVGIENISTDTAYKASGKVHFRVLNSTSHAVVFSDSATYSNLKTNKETDIVSPTSFGFNVPGNYDLLAYHVKSDEFRENDTLTASFEVKLNSVIKINGGKIKVYPNPASDYAFIYATENITGARLFALTGQELPVTFNSGKMYLNNVSNGIYLIKVEVGNKEYSSLLQVLK